AEHRVHCGGLAGAGGRPGGDAQAAALGARAAQGRARPRVRAHRYRGGGTGRGTVPYRPRDRPEHTRRRPLGALPDDGPAARGVRGRDACSERPDPAGRRGRPARPGLPARPHLRRAPAPPPELLRPAPGRRRDEPHHERRGYPEPVSLPGRHAASRLALQPPRHRRGDAVSGLQARPRLLHHHPGDAADHLVLRQPGAARVPPDPRDGRRRDGGVAGGDRRGPRGPGLQPRRGEHRPFQGAERGQQDGERAGRRGHLGVRPRDRRPQHALHRARDRLRRLPRLRGLPHGRAVGGVPDLRPAVFQAGAARLAGLHPGPIRPRRGRAHLRDPGRRARAERPSGDAGARPGRGAHSLRGGLLRLRAGAARPERRLLRGRAGADGRPRRGDGRRQDHDREPHPPLLRRNRRLREDRRARRASDDAPQREAQRRHGLAGAVPVLRYDLGEHKLRPRRGRGSADARGDRTRRPRRPGRRFHPGAAGGLRGAPGRGRGLPEPGPTPASLLRPRRAGRPRHPDPRRGDEQHRHAHRGRGPGRPKGPPLRPHERRDRPPPEHDPRRGQDTGGGGWPDRGERQPRRTSRRRWPLRGPIPPPVSRNGPDSGGL
ncbi:MAG: Heterodimeric efflux ABC transporter, permease/ATP-binding subunit 2, partial [uncultured Rubrobacteraceae bacterium]